MDINVRRCLALGCRKPHFGPKTEQIGNWVTKKTVSREGSCVSFKPGQTVRIRIARNVLALIEFNAELVHHEYSAFYA